MSSEEKTTDKDQMWADLFRKFDKDKRDRWSLSEGGDRDGFYISVHVEHPGYGDLGECWVIPWVVEVGVAVQVMVRDVDGEWVPDSRWTISHDDFLAYLHSLPVPFTGFGATEYPLDEGAANE